MRRNPNAHALLIGQPWAITKPVFNQAMRMIDASVKDFQSAAGDFMDAQNSHGGLDVIDGVAVIDVLGPITRYSTCLSSMYGYATVDDIMAALDLASTDPSVKSVLLNVNSPGGSVDGISELASQIRGYGKPVVAYVGGMAASAAYWIAAQAHSIVTADTASVGSIGVYAAMEDDTRMYSEAGIDRYMVVSSQSPNKVPDPATEAGKSQIQSHVDALAEIFIQAVADGRGVRTQTVMETFGQGDIFLGAEAVKRGMADRVGVFYDALTLASSGDMNRRSIFAEEKPAGVAQAEIENTEVLIMTLEELKAKHPDVYQAAVAEAVSGAVASERTRLLALDDIDAGGEHTDIIKEAKSSGKSAEQAALTILKAQKGKVDKFAAARAQDGADLPKVEDTQPSCDEDEATKAKSMISGIAAGFKAIKEVK